MCKDRVAEIEQELSRLSERLEGIQLIKVKPSVYGHVLAAYRHPKNHDALLRQRDLRGRIKILRRELEQLNISS
jgi:hypothetical protein